MGKYVVRKPFAVHLERIVESKQPNGTVVKRKIASSHFSDEDQTIELTDENAMAHMHKLEPVDDDAKKLFGDYHAMQAKVRADRTEGEGPSLDDRIAAAVAKALAAERAKPAEPAGKGAKS